MTDATTLPVAFVDVVEGPLYMTTNLDGEPVDTYDIYVSVATAWGKGNIWTHERSFSVHERAKAERLANAVAKRGRIDPCHWRHGSAWDGVRAEVEVANEYAAMGATEADLEAMGLA